MDKKQIRTSSMPWWLAPLAAIATTLLAMIAAPSVAHAGFRICVVGKVLTTDSGITVPSGANAGDTEDYWSNGNNGLSKAIPGLLVSVDHASYAYPEVQSMDSSGCADFDNSANFGSTVKILSQTYLGGVLLQVHDAPYDFSPDPQGLYSYTYKSQNLYTNLTHTYTNIGSGLAKWTALFATSKTLDVYDHLLASGSIISLGMGGCSDPDFASAHYDNPAGENSFDWITSNYYFLGVANCSSTLKTRRKFTLAHELGHAIAALYYGDHASAVDGEEPNVLNTHNVNPNACSGGSGYTIKSKEWNSVGFREGYAHFFAAAAWNDKHDPGAAGASGTGDEGSFTWFLAGYDLERYNQGAGSGTGGRLENTCCTSGCAISWHSAGTIGDWMLFFWDYYSVDSCTNDPTKEDMLKIYRKTRLNGGLYATNYYDKIRAAMRDIYGSSCLRSNFDTWAAWNGVDNG